MAFIVLYVDDMLIGRNDLTKLEEIKSKLNQSFQMKDLGEPDIFLGMKISRDKAKRIMKLSQLDYTRKVLERFNMVDTAPHDTPMLTRQVKNRETRNRVAARTKEPGTIQRGYR